MQLTPKVAFIVFGVHKDGLLDPMGTPFIDDALIAQAKAALRAANVELVEHDVILATKAEAQACLNKFKKMDDLDAIVLFSGTWVWAAHLVAALRDFAATGKGIVLWTNPGSQGWRPVGGLVMHGGLKEVGIPHRFVYGSYDDPRTIERIGAYCRAERDGQPAEHEHLRRVRRPRHGADVRRGRPVAVDAGLRRGHRLARHHAAARNRQGGHAGRGRGCARPHPAVLQRPDPRRRRVRTFDPAVRRARKSSWRRRGGTSTPSSRSPAWATTTALPALRRA